MKRKIFYVTMFSLCLVLISGIAFAGVWTGGFPASIVQDLHYVLNGGDNNYQTNIMSAGANLWNGISSKVHVSRNASGAKVSIFKTTTDRDGLYGETIQYYRYLGVLKKDTTHTNIWEVVDINGYDNKMSEDDLNDTEKKAIYGHEMGHALSLSHTQTQGCLMYETFVFMGMAPNSTDAYWLKTKWGA